ncbi:hypothetical protein GCM10009846_11030 [Agrococcus versicolor]|uniref:Secreted protein n=1 Tax=Agrococcus versicolor TaxID=501482 RepID=A0ABN3AP77_9MICO
MHRTRSHGTLPLVLAASAALALAGCTATAATAPTPSSAGAPSESPATPDEATELGAVPEPVPSGEVVAQGLVLDAGTPVLCLGDVAASAPPQCGGIPLVGWDWSAIDGWEQSASTRWGSYAVQGTFDGETFRVTADPISLALYDVAPIPEAPREPGTTPEDELARIQGVLQDALGDRLLAGQPVDGTLDATVVFDDGTLQEHLDEVYGANVVRVMSAMRAVDAP